MLAFPSLKPQETAKIFIKKADILIQQKKYKDGLALLNAYAPQDPDDMDETLFYKAEAYYGLGDMENAFNFFGNVVQNFLISRFAPAALLGQAHSREQAGKFKDAQDLFLKYYQAQSDPALKSEALFGAVNAASQAGDFNKAIGLARDYLKNFPQAALQNPNSIYFLLGFNLQAAGQADAALAAYTQVDPQKEEGKFYLAALKNMAIIYLTRKNTTQAKVCFEKLINQAGPNDLGVKTYIWLCNEYLKEQKYDDVLRVAALAEKNFPASGDLQKIKYFEGEALRAEGRCDEAGKDYDMVAAAAQKDAYTASAEIGHGLCLEKASQYDGARAQFQKALDENPDDYSVTAHARFEIANAEYAQGNLEDALKTYMLIATIHDSDQFCSQSLLKAGQIAEKLKRRDDALKMYNEVLDKYKDMPSAVEAQERLNRLK
jgi:tetratricopeptide (TPR) repeat protein